MLKDYICLLAMRRLLLIILSLICLFLLILNAFYVWDWSDDYALKQVFKTASLWQFQWHEYCQLDGRSLNLGYFFSRACVKSDIVYLASLIATLLMLFSSYCLNSLFALRKGTWPEGLISTVFITGLLWLASFFVLSNTLYYQTCTLYVFELVHLVLVYYIKTNWPRRKILQVLAVMLFFMFGMSSPGAVIAFSMVLLIEYFKEKKAGEITGNKYVFVFIALALGFLIVVLSPGTAIRYQYNIELDVKPFQNINNFYFFLHQVVGTLYKNCSSLVWLFAGFGFYMALVQIQNHKRSIVEQLFVFRWLIAAVVSVVFYFPKGYLFLSSSRLSLQFIWFIVLFFLSNYKSFGKPMPERVKHQIIGIGFIVLIVVLASEGLNSKHSQWKMRKRVALYKVHKGKNLILKANDIIGPPVTRLFEDVNEDSASYPNRITAEYFGILSIDKEKY